MVVANDWKDYELIDTGSGEKLERWGNYILRRPDPQIVWPIKNETNIWKNADAVYHRSQNGGGNWQINKKLPKTWNISYKKISFIIEPTSFKHTGIFPEQAVNWDWMIKKIKNTTSPIKVLNLFAYTGGASVACAFAGAEVCHVDASKGMVQRAKENISLSGLNNSKVRFIVDDVIKFVQKEKRRNNFYDAIIMDPPSYGRGPSGELWKIENELFGIVNECKSILSKDPLFFLINSYTSGFSPSALENILKLIIKNEFVGNISSGEVGIPVTNSNIVLPCGIYARWESGNY